MITLRVAVVLLTSALVVVATVTETTIQFGNETFPRVPFYVAIGLNQTAEPLEPSEAKAEPNVAHFTTAASLAWTVAQCALVALGAALLALVTLLGWTCGTLGFQTVSDVVASTTVWWRGFAHYWWYGGTYEDFPNCTDSLESRVYIRSIALAMTLWSLPHYRNGCFQEDMEKNLRNVAIPGTGVPLSVFCRSKLRFYLAVLVVAPIACLYAAVVSDTKAKKGVAERYATFLLHPQDWFTLWRINCCLASYHAHVTGSNDYKAEDKWTFLKMAEEKAIPVSPTLELPAIVVKDRNEEGGMGIKFYANSRFGGDWIIQKVLNNAPFLSDLLPKQAPLSTIRIVTASRVTLVPSSGGEASTELIEPLSCVLRLGRENAETDHDAILFDADIETGSIREGTINKSWYQLGWNNATLTPPVGAARFDAHPDSGATVTGLKIPNMAQIRELVKRAHLECCPEVPLCGWDVALTTEGTLLLEVNLSCNFFQATIDREHYFRFVDDHFRQLERIAAH